MFVGSKNVPKPWPRLWERYEKAKSWDPALVSSQLKWGNTHTEIIAQDRVQAQGMGQWEF